MIGKITPFNPVIKEIDTRSKIDIFYPSAHVWGDINGVEKLRLLCRLVRNGFSPPFEFGTFRGLTTFNLVKNLPDATHKVFTIDCDNQCNESSSNIEQRTYASYNLGEEYIRRGLSHRVVQLVGDSVVLDFTEHYGKFGLVFVDAGHSYDAIKKDTETAFKLVRQGGVIVWDDYGDYWPDVKKYLDELSLSHELFTDSGLVIHFAS